MFCHTPPDNKSNYTINFTTFFKTADVAICDWCIRKVTSVMVLFESYSKLCITNKNNNNKINIKLSTHLLHCSISTILVIKIKIKNIFIKIRHDTVTNLDITLLNEELSDTEMVRKQEPSSRETKPRTRNDTSLTLSFNVLHSLLPNDVGFNLILHHSPNPLLTTTIRIKPTPIQVLKHGHRTHLPIRALAGPSPYEEPRRQAQEELAGGDGERLLLGGGEVGGLGRRIVVVVVVVFGEGEDLGAARDGAAVGEVRVWGRKERRVGG